MLQQSKRNLAHKSKCPLTVFGYPHVLMHSWHSCIPISFKQYSTKFYKLILRPSSMAYNLLMSFSVLLCIVCNYFSYFYSRKNVTKCLLWVKACEDHHGSIFCIVIGPRSKKPEWRLLVESGDETFFHGHWNGGLFHGVWNEVLSVLCLVAVGAVQRLWHFFTCKFIITKIFSIDCSVRRKAKLNHIWLVRRRRGREVVVGRPAIFQLPITNKLCDVLRPVDQISTLMRLDVTMGTSHS